MAPSLLSKKNMRRFFLILPLLTLLASMTACSTYSVRRSALVPHMVPTTRNGQAMQRTMEGNLALPTLAQAGAPSEAATANAGLFIPRTQVNAALRTRVTKQTDVGFTWDHGLSKGAQKISPDQPNMKDQNVYGGGIALNHSAPTSNPHLSIGLTSELQLYSIPFVEYRTCIDACPLTGFTEVVYDRSLVPVASLGITPSYKQGAWVFFGGLTVRNHPTIEKGEIEKEKLIEDDDEVSAGHFNAVVNAGAEYEFADGFRAMVHLYQPVTADPVRYKPTLGIGLTVPLSGS